MSNEQQHDPSYKPLRASMNYEETKPPYPDANRELTPKEIAAIETARRLEREEISVQSGLVAGHDFKREYRERSR